MPRRLLPVAVLVTTLAVAGCGDAQRLNGGGASFVYPAILKWTRAYDKQFNVEIDYTSTGSGNGVSQMKARTIQFGCSDAFVKDADKEKDKKISETIVHIPLVMGGVVPIYNVPEAAEPLRFTGAVLADIYLGKIKKWDDKAIAELNPGVPLPAQNIACAYRSDSSGTTAIFTEFLGKSSPTWADKEKGPGSGTTVKWPKGVGSGHRGNEGVAGFVGRAPYSIGYVELIYARQNNTTYGAVETADSVKRAAEHAKKAGTPLPVSERVFLRASLETVSAAAAARMKEITEKHPDLRYSLINSPGPNSYPIAGTNWCVFYKEQPRGTGETLLAFLRWATKPGGDGQKMAADLGYAPLPAALAESIEKRLALVTLQD